MTHCIAYSDMCTCAVCVNVLWVFWSYNNLLYLVLKVLREGLQYYQARDHCIPNNARPQEGEEVAATWPPERQDGD